MYDLVIVMILLVGFFARTLLAGRRCRCADAARTTQWRREDVSEAPMMGDPAGCEPAAVVETKMVDAPTMRSVTACASVTALATEIVVAPARITRVGY